MREGVPATGGGVPNVRYIEAVRDRGSPGAPLYRFWYDEAAFPLRLKKGPMVPNERAYMALLRARGFRVLSRRTDDGQPLEVFV